jgi:hypothetical protein
VLRTDPGYGGLQPDGFHFTLLSDPGVICGLQSSTNLADWQEFLAVTNSTGSASLLDPAAASAPGRLYRAVARLP